MTLYELTEQYMTLMEMAEDPETDQQTLADTMDAITGEIEDKADSYAVIINSLKSDADVLDAEIKRLTARKAAMLANAERMKSRLMTAMIMAGREKIKTARYTLGIQKTTPSVVLDTDDLEKIPAEYLIKQEPKIDKRGIAAALKGGKDMPGVAHLEQGVALQIR